MQVDDEDWEEEEKEACTRHTDRGNPMPTSIGMAPHIDRVDELQQVLGTPGGTKQQQRDSTCQVLGQTQTELPAPET